MRWIATACLGWLALSPVAFSQQPISPVQFRDRLIVGMKAINPGLCIRIRDERAIDYGPSADNCSYFAAIDNQYREYVNSGGSPDESIARFARIAVELLNEQGISKEDIGALVAVLRPVEYVAGLGDVVSREFAGDLVAVLMIDGEDRMKVLDRSGLDMLGLSADEAFEKARQNLPGRVGPLAVNTEQGVRFVFAVSGLATGTLLSDDACGSESLERFVLVVDRNTYVAASSSDKRAVDAFWRLANGLIRDGESASRTVLACRSGKWIVAKSSR